MNSKKRKNKRKIIGEKIIGIIKENRIIKSLKKCLPYVLLVAVAIIFPLVCAWLIDRGHFLMINFKELSFGMQAGEWFAFWGSYTAAALSIVLAVINYRLQKQIRRMDSKPIVSKVLADLENETYTIPGYGRVVQAVYTDSARLRNRLIRRLKVKFQYYNKNSFVYCKVRNITLPNVGEYDIEKPLKIYFNAKNEIGVDLYYSEDGNVKHYMDNNKDSEICVVMMLECFDNTDRVHHLDVTMLIKGNGNGQFHSVDFDIINI